MWKNFTILVITTLAVFSVASQSPLTDTVIVEITKNNIAVVRLFNDKKFSEALPLAKKVIELTEQKYGSATIEMAKAYGNLGYVLFFMDETKAAQNAFEKAIKIYKKIPNLEKKDNEETAKIIELLAIEKQKRDFTFAESDLEEAALWREKISGANAKELVTTYFLLANISYWKKEYKKSAERYSKVLDLIEKNQSFSEDDTNLAYYRCRCSFIKAGKNEELKELEQKFEEKIVPQNPFGFFGVKGGVVNGKALNLVKPAYPQAAKNDRASGMVNVEVLIGKTGKVLSACGSDKAHKALIEASEIAALNSTFSPTTISGKAVTVTGVIVYNFTAR